MFGGTGNTGNPGFGQASNQNNSNQSGPANPAFSFGGLNTGPSSATPAFGASASSQGNTQGNTQGATQGTSQGTPLDTSSGLFGAKNDTAAKPAAGFSFGAPNTANQQFSAAGGLGFGSSFATGAAPSNTGAQPSLFGNTAAAAATTVSTQQSTSLFGSASSANPGTPLFGSAPSHATPAAPALFATTPSCTPAPAPATGLSNTLGQKAYATSKPPLFGTPSASDQASVPASSGLFGSSATAKPSITGSASGSTAPSSLFGAPTKSTPAGPLKVDDLGKATTLSTSNATTLRGLAAAKPAGPVATNPATGSISVLKNKSVEDILYKWSTELDNYTREFQRQAIQIQKWDHAIVSNGALVTRLFNELQDVEACEKEIDQNLEYIEAQQNELESALETYSSQIQTIISQDQANPNSRFRSTPADEDREKAYVLAEHLNTKLDDMASSLSIVINELNNARKKGDTNTSSIFGIDESPLESITQILNAHLTSLEWIERSSGKLELKVEKLKGLEKQVASKILNQ